MVNKFLTDNYDDIIVMSKRICKGSREHEDVAHYCITKFLEHKRAEELVIKNEAMRFLSGMIHRSFHSSTSQYHTLYRQKGRVHPNSDNAQHKQDRRIQEEYNEDLDLATEAILGILEEMQSEPSDVWFRAKLFELWLETPNFSELERRTKIPRTSISQAVSECREYIRRELKQRNIDL